MSESTKEGLNDKTVLVTFCVDTEGPLYESLDAKFERLEELFDVKVPRTSENLDKIRTGDLDLGGKEQDAMRVLSGHLTNYNETWDQVERMLERALDRDFRFRLPDSYGGGWVYNWFTLEHVGFVTNPRRRDLGHHNVFDFYRAILSRLGADEDGLQWHFHPMSTYNEAHRCATAYFSRTPLIYEILSRKILERNWFPSAYRAGFQTERPDSNWFLEQWIPFDISNMALDDNSELNRTTDFRNGRSGDWRLAPSDWSVYNPDHDNYQLPGQCRRYIGRALNVLNRIASIDQQEVDKAFARAQTGKPTLMGMAVHDFRDLTNEVEHITELIARAQKSYPDVKFKYCEVNEAFRYAVWQDADPGDLELTLSYEPASKDDVPTLRIDTTAGKVFGPQPFLAIQTAGGRFFHDNLDFSTDGKTWFYAFHGDTLPIEDVRKVGVAANNLRGKTCVKTIGFHTQTDYETPRKA